MNGPFFIKTIYLLTAIVFLQVNIAEATSLYDEKTFVPMHADHKGWRLGDNITVVIIESATALSSADDSASREFSMEGGLDVAGIDEAAKAKIGSDSDSGGKTQRAGRLKAQITTVVTSIDKSGRMLIEGEQAIVINDEMQKIKVKGWVRPNDVDANNVVLSTRLADAQFEYDGYGSVTEQRKPGLIQRFFNAIGLF